MGAVMGQQTSGVYLIVNTINGKMYVGSAKRFSARWSVHRSELNGGKHDNRHLQNAWNKYGADAFTFREWEAVELDRLIEREQFWIDYFDATRRGYNLSPVAGNTLGVKYTDEAKRRISVAKTGKPLPPFSAEHRRKIGLANKGKVVSAATRAKLRQASLAQERRTGYTLSAETRQKISDARKAKPHSGTFQVGHSVSEETRRKIGEANRGRQTWVGKQHSAESKAKMSKAKKGRKLSEETRRKMSEVRKGKVQSEETKRKLALARKQWWEKKKATADCSTVAHL